MAFFKKLKDRLFKTSSKIGDGLDAIVEDGGSVAPAELPSEPDVVHQLDPAAQEPAGSPQPRNEAPDHPAAEPQPSPAPAPPEPASAVAAPEPVAASSTPAEVAARVSEPPVQRVETPAPPAEQAKAVPAPPLEPSEPSPTRPVERAEAVQAPAPLVAEASPPAAVTSPKPADAAASVPPEEEPQRRGLLGRLLGRRSDAPVLRRTLDDDMLEQLEELLITADMGVDTALRVSANLADSHFGKKLSTDEIKALLAAEIARIMDPVARPLPLYPSRPQVVLVVGVNGSGKTTTIGKLASQFRAAGKKVVIAAGDTFRAAAVEQLQVWGERAGVPVLTAPEGSDPASLAYDALEQAQRDGADLLMIDTAGRLQNRADLMEELAKIVRVIRKRDPDAPHNTLLVLDATTGQNAVSQVDTFRKLADVSGLVMTKLDGTAKGGVLVALADKFGLPIHAIGVGEQIDDLAPFDPEEFAEALTGA